MKILVIDTCGATGSVALVDTDREPVIAAKASLAGRSASERLVPAIRELSENCGMGLHALDALAVVHGPGSFSGVRVGLSAAKGLCEALGLPLVAISRLAVLARLAAAGAGVRVVALLDAGRGEFYCGEYVDGMGVQEALLTHDEVVAAVDRDLASVVVVCEAGVAQAVALLTPQAVAEPDAEAALSIALARIERGEFDDVATVDANYVRRTDAEIFAKPTPRVDAARDSQTETPVR